MSQNNGKGQAIVAVLRSDGRFLVIRRGPETTMCGYWAPLSGRLEPGESQSEALVREVREEVGLNVLPGVKVWECDTHDGEYRLHYWTAAIQSDEFGHADRLTLDPGEVSEARWVTVPEFLRLEPLFDTDQHFFRTLYPTLDS